MFFSGQYSFVLCPSPPSACTPRVGGPTRSVQFGTGLTVVPASGPIRVALSAIPAVTWFHVRPSALDGVVPGLILRSTTTFRPAARLRPQLALQYERLAPHGAGPDPRWLMTISLGLEGW